jgi:hypothetical protein
VVTEPTRGKSDHTGSGGSVRRFGGTKRSESQSITAPEFMTQRIGASTTNWSASPFYFMPLMASARCCVPPLFSSAPR